MAGIALDNLSSLSPEMQRIYQTAAGAERKPIESINLRKTAVEEKVGLLEEVLSKVDAVQKVLPTLNSPIAIRELTVVSNDDRIIVGTADKHVAEAGAHNIEIVQLANRASAMSNGFEDKDQTSVGTGYFSFTMSNGETREVFVDDENGSLDGLSKLINSSRMGVKASVIYDASSSEAPYRLLLTSDGTGSENGVEYPEFYLIDGEEELYMEREKPAANAIVRYEGFEVESPSNEIKDMVRGVTLNLRGLSMGQPTAVTITQDIPRTIVKVKDLVGNLNQVFGFIQNQNTLDENTQTLKTLGGDYGIRHAEQRIRSALQQPLSLDGPKKVRVLNDIGIQFNKKGTLEFDEKKFENALNASFEEVVELLAGDGIRLGVIPRLSMALNSLTVPGTGLLSAQRSNYNSRIRDFQRQIEDKEKHAEKRMEFLKEKLASVQGAISKLQGQTSFLGETSGLAGLV